MLKNKTLLIQSAYSLSLKSSVTFLGLLSTIALARYLGPSELGSYTLILTIIMVISLPVKAGLPQLIVREISKYKVENSSKKIKGLIVFSNTFIIAFTMILFFIFYLYNTYYNNIWTKNTLFLIFSLVLVLAFNETRSATLRGLGSYFLGQIPDNLIRPLVFIIIIILIIFSGYELNVQSTLVAYFISVTIAFMVGNIFLYKNNSIKGLAKYKPIYDTKIWLYSSIPMSMSNIFHLANTQIDILLLGYYLSTYEIGIYRISVQISLLIAFSLQASKMISEPIFSRLLKEGSFNELQKTIKYISRLNSVFSILILVLILIFGKTIIILLFGIEYIDSFVPFVILASARLVSSFLGTGGYLLNMAGFEKRYAGLWLISAFINIILNILLIPIFGINGAALSTALSLIFANIYTWYLAKKLTKYNCSPF